MSRRLRAAANEVTFPCRTLSSFCFIVEEDSTLSVSLPESDVIDDIRYMMRGLLRCPVLGIDCYLLRILNEGVSADCDDYKLAFHLVLQSDISMPATDCNIKRRFRHFCILLFLKHLFHAHFPVMLGISFSAESVLNKIA